ncbi:MAG: F0F1 ATP synthase subunit A, partial [Mesoflavibacter sp.]|nr:F0F1 ATP synthase subunit A [Mesoflavibacter sp.]
MLVILFFPQLYWLVNRKVIKLVKLIIKNMIEELRVVLGRMIRPGRSLLFLSIFFFILLNNVIGLLPYVFTSSRHLSFTLSLSLPLWLGRLLISLIKQFNKNMAHLVPEGTPPPLIPLMVIIESIRLVIRPFTLAVRLRANIIAGHLLLRLLGGRAV